MKKLIATCIILGCLLMPLKGYSENSKGYSENSKGYSENSKGYSKNSVMTFLCAVVAAGMVGLIIIRKQTPAPKP